MGRGGRFPDLRVGRFRPAEGDVVTDRAVEEQGFLQDQADLIAQGLDREASQILTFDQDRPGARVVEARQQAHERALARARGSDDGQLFAGLDDQVDAREHLAAGVVGERNRLELDAPLEGVCGNRPWEIGDLLPLAQDLDHALRSDLGPVEAARAARERAHRGIEVRHVGEEDDDVSGRELAGQDTRRAVPHDEPEASGREEVDEGSGARLEALDLESRLQAHPALGLEAVVLLLLLDQSLDDADRGERLLGHRGHEPVARARLARGAPNAPAEAQDRQEEQGRDGQRHQCESPIDPQHDGQHPCQQEGVHHHDVRGVRQEVVDGVDVAAEPRRQVAGALAVVKAQRQALHVCEEAPSQVEREVFADEPHRAAVVEGRESRAERDQDRGRACPIEDLLRLEGKPIQPPPDERHARGLLGDHAVDDDLQRPGPQHGEQRVEQHGQVCQDEGRGARPEQTQEVDRPFLPGDLGRALLLAGGGVRRNERRACHRREYVSCRRARLRGIQGRSSEPRNSSRAR